MSMRQAYWVVFVICLGVYMAMVIWTLPGISAAAGGLPAFDLRPTGYSPQEARDFLAALGGEGRALYLGPQRVLDLFYPALLAIVLAGGLWRLTRANLLRWVLLAAILGGMVADYTENMLVGGLLQAPDPVTDQAVIAASRATIVKSALTGLAMLGLVVTLVVKFIRHGKPG